MLSLNSMATQERDVIPAGAGIVAPVPEVGLGLGPEVAGEVKARGYWEGVWLRFKRDKFAIGGGLFIIFILIAGFVGAPIAEALLGHGPDDIYPTNGGLDPNTFLPVGPFTTFEAVPYPGATGDFPSVFFLLGADGQLARDEFLRMLYGTQTSLEVAVGATLVSMTIGVLLGAMAGFFGGWIDTIVSRLTELVMAFPILLFTIALASTIGDRLDNVTFGFLGKGVVTLIVVLGCFGWYYPARVIRGQVLSLREKEFVEAARMIGASDWRIIRSHILPHLVAPIIVYSTLVIAQFILAEAGLSYLGLGIEEPTPSWGKLLSAASEYYLAQPWLMVWPGMAILLATLSFNLLGDGLRDAFDPRSSR
jgi:ABC-type dipeptide/oligopeptide/nickel transport system permease subunit